MSEINKDFVKKKGSLYDPKINSSQLRLIWAKTVFIIECENRMYHGHYGIENIEEIPYLVWLIKFFLSYQYSGINWA